jgi:Hypoxia induced protein conserved region
MAPSDPLPSSFDYQQNVPETTFRRMLRRVREEPLIPLGMILTVAALTGAGSAIRARDHVRANLMFRRRIYAQGFTLLAVVGGSYYLQGDRAKRKEADRLAKEKENAEQREMWLKELEAREEEDRAAKERVQKLMERRKRRQEEVSKKEKEIIVDAKPPDLGTK